MHATRSGPLARTAMAFVLAGGRGSRLMELTDRRAKPAVYFGGKSRIIDFALSNAHQFRHPPHRGRHAVQGAQPDPPPAARLELPPARAQRELRHPAGQPARLGEQVVSRAPPMRCSRTSTSSTSYGAALHRAAGRRPHLQDGLRADAAAARRQRRRRDGGLHEVPRAEARGFGVMQVDANGPHRRVPGKAGRPARHARTSRNSRWPAWASTSSRRKFLLDRAAAGRRRSGILARLRQGHHPLHRRRTARPWRTASSESCVRSRRRGRALLARRRHGGCLLGSQYRPHRRRPGARPLRPATGRSGPMPRSRRRRNSSMTSTAGAARRSPRSSPAAASSPAPRPSIRCCSPACACIPTRRSTARCCCRRSMSAGSARLTNVVVDRGVRIPRRPGGGRGPGGRRRALPPHGEGHLPDHPGDARPARRMTLRVLAVASECFPLIKTGGLADVVGALPAALAAEGDRGHHAAAGLPGGAGGDRRGAACALALPDCSAARRGCSRAQACAGSTCWCWTRRISSTGRATPMSAPGGETGRTTASASPRSASPRPRRRGRRSAFDAVHAHDWQAGLGRRLSAARRRRGACPGLHHPQPGLPGAIPAGALRRGSACRPRPVGSTGVEYYGSVGFLKAGLLVRRPHHHRLAHLCRRDPHGRGRHGARRAAARPRRGVSAASSTASTRRIWDPATRPAPGRALRRRRTSAARRQQGGAAGPLRPGRRPAAPLFGFVGRLAWQKGMDLVLEALPALLAQGGQLAILGTGDAALEDALPRRRRGASRPGRHAYRLRRGAGALIYGGADAVLVPSRFEPCGLAQLCALRYGALPVVARVGGLADTVIDANEVALAAGVAHRRAIRPRRCRDAGQRDPADRRPVPRPGGLARAPAQCAWPATSPGAAPPRATPRCSR